MFTLEGARIFDACLCLVYNCVRIVRMRISLFIEELWIISSLLSSFSEIANDSHFLMMFVSGIVR